MPPLFDSGFDDWNPDGLHDLTGKTYFITGANSGIGFEAAAILKTKNANVLVGARNEGRGRSAVARLVAKPGTGSVEFIKIDLANTQSIRDAATELRNHTDGLDAIINNAGIMQTPEQQTADGFEMQFGTNHLGHFLMNQLLFDLVEERSGRIVPVSSVAHRSPSQIYFDNVMMTGRYDPTRAYGQSKLANLIYGLELQRRLEKSNREVSSITCHPGYAATQLQTTGPTGLWKKVYAFTNATLAQSAERGSHPLVLAAAAPEARPGGYYGPVGFGGARGKISDSNIVNEYATDEWVGEQLWSLSEDLLGISFSP